MDFNQNLKAFLKGLPLKNMSGHQKFLAVAVLQCHAKTDSEVSVADVRSRWRRSLLQAGYNPSLYDRAQREGWVNPVAGAKGRFLVTTGGLEHLSALEGSESVGTSGDLKRAGALIIVNRKGTHSFDKFLRQTLAEAKKHVLIADSYVDGTVFDTVLDAVPQTTIIKLVYAHDSGNFAQRSNRFSRQYQQFTARKYKWLHDRFMIVDETGYVLGPSIKDAAFKYPALVVIIGQKESRSLHTFFDDLWTKAK
jgi:hypothetical protein